MRWRWPKRIAAWTIRNLRDQTRLFLLSAPAFLYGSHALHALDPELDALCVGPVAGSEEVVTQSVSLRVGKTVQLNNAQTTGTD